MGDEKPKNGGTAKVIEEAFAPAAKEFGKEIVPLGRETGVLVNRVGQLLIRSLGHLVYGLEKAEEYIKEALAKRLKDVPQEKIVEPRPRIAVPAVQALTYSFYEEYIREMFVNLLAADMNADTKGDVHPAFVEFIKEMTPFEARLLLKLKAGDQIVGHICFGTPREFISHARAYSFASELDIDKCPTALNNLDRLGLIEFKDDYPTGFQDWQKETQESAKELFEEWSKIESNKTKWVHAAGFVQLRGIYLTDLGNAFVSVCMKGLK